MINEKVMGSVALLKQVNDKKRLTPKEQEALAFMMNVFAAWDQLREHGAVVKGKEFFIEIKALLRSFKEYLEEQLIVWQAHEDVAPGDFMMLNIKYNRLMED